jgi:hypothetical protein
VLRLFLAPASSSQDVLKTKKKCIDTAQAALRSGQRVIIDATNKDKKVRLGFEACLFCVAIVDYANSSADAFSPILLDLNSWQTREDWITLAKAEV